MFSLMSRMIFVDHPGQVSSYLQVIGYFRFQLATIPYPVTITLQQDVDLAKCGKLLIPLTTIVLRRVSKRFDSRTQGWGYDDHAQYRKMRRPIALALPRWCVPAERTIRAAAGQQG
jgi:hypothetical protein